MANDQQKSKQQKEEEARDLKIEILQKITDLATAGFGLVAALAWNDAIKGLFSKLFPQPGGNLFASFAYAALITAIVVVITVQLGRTVDVAKKQLKKDKNKNN